MTHLVYPGATHSRFQHAIGAMHLMDTAISVIRSKGHEINHQEQEAALASILLHDIGHGPFSHTLESSLVPQMPHEDMSLLLMGELNRQFDGRLTMALDIFTDRYPKRFLHQLVEGQLDVDRLDYLKRDSFYTGVIEGAIGSDRIIKMLNVLDDELIVEGKGIYSIEKFLIARRLMYWQVYFHKTVVSAENLLTKVLKRARFLVENGNVLFASPSLQYFLKNGGELIARPVRAGSPAAFELIENFVNLDDDDILSAAKVWSSHSDRTLSLLSGWLTDRILYSVEFSKVPFPEHRIDTLRAGASRKYGVADGQTDYFVFIGEISNYAYRAEDEKIKILFNDGRLADISAASDMLNLSVLAKTVKKYFLCYPKNLDV